MSKEEERKVAELNAVRMIIFEYLPVGGQSLIYLANCGMTLFEDTFLPPMSNSVYAQVKVFNALAAITPDVCEVFDNERIQDFKRAKYGSGEVTKEEKEKALRQVHDIGVLFTGLTVESFLEHFGVSTLEEYSNSRFDSEIAIANRKKLMKKGKDVLDYCLRTMAGAEGMFDNFSDIFIEEEKNNE